MIPTLDLDAAAVSPDLKAALRAAAAPLEDVHNRLKDWHPGSDGKVLDLVHPSLFPLLYGRSRIVSSGVVGLQDCANYVGKGEVTTQPDDSQVKIGSTYDVWGSSDPKFWSKAFQWLPCDVVFAGDDMKITSYIHNMHLALHPALHPELYSFIEKFIAKSIPLWDMTLSSTYGGRKARILHHYTDYDYPLAIKPPEELGNDWAAREHWRVTNRILQKPEP